mmetsp:Transcript_59131/g.108408  ORF Transcript_59131/g.108408 Transcript_59131/m.108408 type:complete len:225 (+) Transcript_59131:805-1479(+)
MPGQRQQAKVRAYFPQSRGASRQCSAASPGRGHLLQRLACQHKPHQVLREYAGVSPTAPAHLKAHCSSFLARPVIPVTPSSEGEGNVGLLGILPWDPQSLQGCLVPAQVERVQTASHWSAAKIFSELGAPLGHVQLPAAPPCRGRHAERKWTAGQQLTSQMGRRRVHNRGCPSAEDHVFVTPHQRRKSCEIWRRWPGSSGTLALGWSSAHCIQPGESVPDGPAP